MGGRSFGPRPLPVTERSPAHPHVGINHRVDALPPLFPGLHAWMLPAAAAGENLHFYPMNRELLTITLPRSDRAVLEVAGGTELAREVKAMKDPATCQEAADRVHHRRRLSLLSIGGHNS